MPPMSTTLLWNDHLLMNKVSRNMEHQNYNNNNQIAMAKVYFLSVDILIHKIIHMYDFDKQWYHTFRWVRYAFSNCPVPLHHHSLLKHGKKKFGSLLWSKTMKRKQKKVKIVLWSYRIFWLDQLLITIKSYGYCVALRLPKTQQKVNQVVLHANITAIQKTKLF